MIERIMVNCHHFQTQRFKRIAQHRPDCLGHQAFAPMLLAQSITEHSAVGIVPALLLMQPNGADDPAGTAVHNRPHFPGFHKLAQDPAGNSFIRMRLPTCGRAYLRFAAIGKKVLQI